MTLRSRSQTLKKKKSFRGKERFRQATLSCNNSYYKGDNFPDFLFAFLQIKPILKKGSTIITLSIGAPYQITIHVLKFEIDHSITC